MVRPVEPEPPDALRRIHDRVKRTDATPDKLGHQQVKERQQRSGQHHEEKPEEKVDTDLVTIGSRDIEPEPEQMPDSPRKDDDAPDDTRDTRHVDVKV